MVDNGHRSGTTAEYEREYDPYLRKQPKVPIVTNVQAFFFLIHGVVGTGILQAVFVFREGWMIGIIMTVSIGIICTHCQHILFVANKGDRMAIKKITKSTAVKAGAFERSYMHLAKHRVCRTLKVPYLKYAQSVERAFEVGPPSLRKYSRLSHYVVDGCFILCQLGLCCIFSTMALSIAPVADDLFRSLLEFEVNMSILFSVSLLIPLILSSVMINLRIVAQFSILGVFLLLVSSGVFLVYCIQDFKPIGSFEMFDVDVKTLPIYIASLVFSFQAVTVVTHFDEHLQSPRAFTRPCGIMTFGMFLVIIMQCILGISVYWKFDNDSTVISTIPIFFVTDDILVVCTAFYTIYSFISYGLHEYIFVEIMWNRTAGRSSCTRVFVCALPIIASGIYMLARTYTESLLPECFITLILGTVIPILGILIPAAMDISLNWPNNFRQAKLIYFKNIFLVIFGVLSIICSFVYCFLPSNF